MRRRTIVIAAVLAALAASVTAVAAAMVDRTDDRRPGAPGMMWGRQGDGQQPGWERGGARTPEGMMGRGRMMGPGGMTMVSDEYGYLLEMIAHHEEAVTAARQLQRSKRPEMRAFGESIVATQSAQIEQMRSWLAQWYPDRPTTADYQPMMRDLTKLSGDRLDRAFLTDMIRHHMMAVMMSQQLLMRDLAEHPEVAELATSIRDEQHREIVQMHRWLADWFNQQGGMPHGRMGMMSHMGMMSRRAA